jgi:hypothetical protein
MVLWSCLGLVACLGLVMFHDLAMFLGLFVNGHVSWVGNVSCFLA